MSRLAAVHTGQPTQGHGTVPNGKPRVAPAPRTIEDIDKELAALGAGSQAAINPRSAHSAAAATVAAAWLSLSATELEVRNYFRSIDVLSGLELLAKMRHQCNLAAATLEDRRGASNMERCDGCGKTLEEAGKAMWILNLNERDPATGVVMCYHYCNQLCIRERNREKMLPPEKRNKFRVDGQEEGDIR